MSRKPSSHSEQTRRRLWHTQDKGITCNPITHYEHNIATKEQAKKAVRATSSTKRIYLAGYILDTQLIDERAKVFMHKDRQNFILAHRGTQGVADKWPDISAIIRAAKAEKTLLVCTSHQRLRACCAFLCYDHGRSTFPRRSIGTSY
jgi:hypothetical protein